MRNIIISGFLLIVLITNQSFAQAIKGSGKLKTETKAFSNFKHLVLQGNYKITITQGDTEGIRISTDDNLMQMFQTSMDGDVLHITMLADIRKSEEMSVNVSVRDLQSITLLNNVNLKSKQVLHFDDLSIFTSGASQIDCEFYATRLILDLHDQSYTKLKGYAEVYSINSHDESEVNSFAMQSEKCQIISTGYSEVMINCNKTLKLKVTGESNVYYTGEPKITERIFSSNGFIVKRRASEF